MDKRIGERGDTGLNTSRASSKPLLTVFRQVQTKKLCSIEDSAEICMMNVLAHQQSLPGEMAEVQRGFRARVTRGIA